jgi:3-oxoacyl-[acyl-carrier-protein] synthase II
MRRRVAVTGLGVVSPIARDVPRFAAALRDGVSGAGPITLFDPAQLPTRIAAEVRWPGPIERDRKMTFAVDAARQALGETRPPGRGGVSLGIGLELFSMDDMAARQRPGFTRPRSRVDRLTFLQTPSDLCAHLIAHEHRLESPPLTHVSACAAGADAIGHAYRRVASGRCDFMLAGGADSMINPLGVAGFCLIGATTQRNHEPERASRPFDRGRDGFLLGEGAAFLLLEPLEGAHARGAHVHAEIVGYGQSFDAHGISEPHPEARGALQAMRAALDEAGVGPEAIDCINAHGTSTPKNDVVETLAIRRLLGARARDVPVCAVKSMIGHLISAAGAVEAVASILGLERGFVPPTVNLDDPDPACDLDYVPHRARVHRQRYVLSNSFAFGGQNAALLFKEAHA